MYSKPLTAEALGLPSTYNKDSLKLARVLVTSAEQRRGLGDNTRSEIVLEVYHRIERGYCERTLIPFENKTLSPFKPSLDRISNNHDYSLDNIQVVVVMYNYAKNKFSDTDVSKFVGLAASNGLRENIILSDGSSTNSTGRYEERKTRKESVRSPREDTSNYYSVNGVQKYEALLKNARKIKSGKTTEHKLTLVENFIKFLERSQKVKYSKNHAFTLKRWRRTYELKREFLKNQEKST